RCGRSLRGGRLAAGLGDEMGEQLGGGVVRDEQGVPDELAERLGAHLGGGRVLGGGAVRDLPGHLDTLLAEQLGEAARGVRGWGPRRGARPAGPADLAPYCSPSSQPASRARLAVGVTHPPARPLLPQAGFSPPTSAVSSRTRVTDPAASPSCSATSCAVERAS